MEAEPSSVVGRLPEDGPGPDLSQVIALPQL
jgi:hypothetical protein